MVSVGRSIASWRDPLLRLLTLEGLLFSCFTEVSVRRSGFLRGRGSGYCTETTTSMDLVREGSKTQTGMAQVLW